MSARILPFPADRIHRTRHFIETGIMDMPSREHALNRIREARDFLANGNPDWFQRGHCEWQIEQWTEKLAQIDSAGHNIIQLRTWASS